MTTESPQVGSSSAPARALAMQVLATLAMSVTQFNLAGSFAFAGVFIEQLTSPDADVALMSGQIALVAPIFSAGTLFGVVVSSYINPAVGAVRAVQLSVPVITAGWALLGFGTGFAMILAGRTLVGVGVGVAIGPATMYVGEVSSPHIRGRLITAMMVNACFGITCVYLLGWQLGWRHTCLVMGFVPMLLQFGITLVLPRSAKWLIAKGHPDDEAERSLRFYHGHQYDVAKQLAEVRASLGEKHKHRASVLQVLSLLRHRHNRIPLCLVLTLTALFVFSGGPSSSSFAPVIFRNVGSFSSPYIGSILVGVTRMIATVVSSVIIEHVERKTLVIINGVAGGVVCMMTGLYFFYQDQLADYAWISLVCVLLIVGLISIGISPVVNVMFAELLPNAIRAEVGGICLLFFGTCNFIMMYAFPLALDSLGMPVTYWFFTAIHVLMAIFAYWLIPKTRGRSLEEIQKLFVTKTAGVTMGVVHAEPSNQESECTKL